MNKTLKIDRCRSQLILWFIFLIFFSCSKNDDEIVLNEENKSVLENILNMNDFVCKNDDFGFKLSVRNSQLKTEFGREMGASIVRSRGFVIRANKWKTTPSYYCWEFSSYKAYDVKRY